MTAQDMLIFNKNGYYATGSSGGDDTASGTEWVTAALNDSSFKYANRVYCLSICLLSLSLCFIRAGQNTWDSLDTVRLICSVVAWIG